MLFNRRIAFYCVFCVTVAAFPGGATKGAITVTGSQTSAAGSIGEVDIAALGIDDWALWTGVGAPAQQKGAGSLIGNLSEVGTPISGITGVVQSFVWASGGDPTASQGSPGFNAGVVSAEDRNGLDVGEGYAVDLTLPTADGTITFWGVTRQFNATNTLTITDSGDVDVYTDSYTATSSSIWWLTTFTMDWEGATPGEQVTLSYLYTSGGNDPSRVGFGGVAMTGVIPEPSTFLMGVLGAIIAGCMTRRHRRRDERCIDSKSPPE